ncbi:MAG TPA: sigma-54 dependent transcriptional regulator [Steroidobacteraceae bacterium]|nr:sigma-54 dependent transcriptional regulator [Steroidobacteraceae bacterium]
MDSSLLVGHSVAMQEVFRLIERVGPTEASVLLTGESGSGKELAAQMIHECSPRRSKPFIAINCGAIPAGLIEAELFGYEKGSFTGAVRAHAGVFERADGGTLLLDEVTEMPLDMQTRLLRVLESRKFYRVGASTEYSCDVRVIAATNRCPLTAVQAGQLREDLLYRLAVFPIDMPPLRNRGDDVELLASHFLADLNSQSMTQKRLSAHARMTLKEHSWPGNVRELKNCIERAFILGDSLLELAPLIQNASRSEGADLSPNGRIAARDRLEIRVGSRIYDMERSLIEATLDYFKGNKRRAADALGCSLKTLYNKLNGYSQRQECANS